MMKKILSAVLAFAMMVTMLSGCSLFTTEGGQESSNPQGGEESNAPQGGQESSDPQSGQEADTSIQMTELYTFEDPAELEYETRYVLYCDENSNMVATAASYGMQAMYSVMYADADDMPVSYYEFMICDTPENAQAVIELYAAMGSSLSVAEEDPCVIYSSTDADSMEAMLISFQAGGIISGTTVSAYLEYYKTYTGGTIME